MAKNITTQTLESKAKITDWLDVADMFFLAVYIGLSYVLLGEVHEYLHIPFMIFSSLMGAFLTMKSPFNKRRKNYESIYFLVAKDIAIYRPFAKDDKEN